MKYSSVCSKSPAAFGRIAEDLVWTFLVEPKREIVEAGSCCMRRLCISRGVRVFKVDNGELKVDGSIR